MNCREYNFGNWTFGTSDFADLPGGKPVYPVRKAKGKTVAQLVKRLEILRG